MISTLELHHISKFQIYWTYPKFFGKVDLEIIGVYQKAPPIGGTFGEVSESPRLSGSARRARP